MQTARQSRSDRVGLVALHRSCDDLRSPCIDFGVGDDDSGPQSEAAQNIGLHDGMCRTILVTDGGKFRQRRIRLRISLDRSDGRPGMSRVPSASDDFLRTVASDARRRTCQSGNRRGEKNGENDADDRRTCASGCHRRVTIPLRPSVTSVVTVTKSHLMSK